MAAKESPMLPVNMYPIWELGAWLEPIMRINAKNAIRMKLILLASLHIASCRLTTFWYRHHAPNIDAKREIDKPNAKLRLFEMTEESRVER